MTPTKPKEARMTAQELREAIEGYTLRAISTWLAINYSTLLRYLNGELPVPPQAAMLADMLHKGELPERYRPQRRLPKPCPRCEGIAVTRSNARALHYCDKHLGEVIREIEAPYAPKGETQ